MYPESLKCWRDICNNEQAMWFMMYVAPVIGMIVFVALACIVLFYAIPRAPRPFQVIGVLCLVFIIVYVFLEMLAIAA